jgi:predicted transcriptional regulator
MANNNSTDTVVISCRVDKETDGILESMADELNYPKSTVAGLVLRAGTRWMKQQILDAAQEALNNGD